MQERLHSTALANIHRHHPLLYTATGHPARPEGFGSYRSQKSDTGIQPSTDSK